MDSNVTATVFGRGRGRGRRLEEKDESAQRRQPVEVVAIQEQFKRGTVGGGEGQISGSKSLGRGRGKSFNVDHSVRVEPTEGQPSRKFLGRGRGRFVDEGGMKRNGEDEDGKQCEGKLLGMKISERYVDNWKETGEADKKIRACSSENVRVDEGELISNRISLKKASEVSLESEEQNCKYSKESKVPVSNYLPRYFKLVKPANRLRKLKRAKVKLLDVLDDAGNVVIAFQDDISKERFDALMKNMSQFYSTPEGFALLIPEEYLQEGEIVAAKVVAMKKYSNLFRRVKILRKGGTTENGATYAVDIDDLSHCRVKYAYALHENFYQHPVQTCKLVIKNFGCLYPKDVFEAVFQKREDFFQVMNDLSYEALVAMIRQHLFVKNLSTIKSDGGIILNGELDTVLNWRLRATFLEEFHKYFTPVLPEEGIIAVGTITNVFLNGDVSICLEDSLFELINKILNGPKMQQLAENMSKTDKEDLVKKIKTRECSLYAAFDRGRSRILRFKVSSVYGDKIKGSFMDASKDTLLNGDDLICSLMNFSELPIILASIPPQAIKFHLAGVEIVTSEEQKQMIGVKVDFKVRGTKHGLDGPYEVEVYM